jgi:hypothetical protein
MKIRLMGTEAECARVAFLLRFGPPDLEVLAVSEPYRTRNDAGERTAVDLEVRFPEGRPPVEATFYSLTGPDGRPLLVDAWGVPSTAGVR